MFEKIFQKYKLETNPFILNPSEHKLEQLKYHISKNYSKDVYEALLFAEKAHGEQKRKYTGEKYIFHPIEVMKIVSTICNDDAMFMAALLHDTVEDTKVTIEEIEEKFGLEVKNIVSDLTDVSKSEDGNRVIRKKIDREHSGNASDKAQTVKLADLISNSASIVKHDENFAKIYLKEKALLLNVLVNGNKTLAKIANDILEESGEYLRR